MPNSEGLYITSANWDNLMITGKKRPTRVVKTYAFDSEKIEVNTKGFKFGADPEGFLFDKKKDLFIPAVGLIPGDKQDPHKVNKGAVQVDGLAAEINIDPASTYEEWEENLTTVIAELNSFLPKNVEVRWVPTAEFDPSVFDPVPDKNKMLGCDPDIDAYTGGTNPPPMMENPYLRCAGGHLHFGFTDNESLSDIQHLLNCQDLAKQLDWFLGGWSVFKDADITRRKLYGKMGAIRYKPYGVEYRVLSNFWVPDKELRREVWNRMVIASDTVGGYYLPDRASGAVLHDLRMAINDHIISPSLQELAEYPLLTLDGAKARM